MSADFKPQNDLERQLIAAQEGQIPPEVFIQTLLGSDVFMPVYEKHQIGGFTTETKADPLKVQSEDGEDVLALSTSAARNRLWHHAEPGPGCRHRPSGPGYGPDRCHGRQLTPIAS